MAKAVATLSESTPRCHGNAHPTVGRPARPLGEPAAFRPDEHATGGAPDSVDSVAAVARAAAPGRVTPRRWFRMRRDPERPLRTRGTQSVSAAGQGANRLKGRRSTCPMETRPTVGKGDRSKLGSSNTAPAPRAAALRKMAPRFSWSLTPSTTTATATGASSGCGVGLGQAPGQRQHPAVDRKPGDAVEDLATGDIHRRPRCCAPLHRVGQCGEPFWAEQDRQHGIWRCQQGAHRSGSLDDEDPVLPLGPPPESCVGKPPVRHGGPPGRRSRWAPSAPSATQPG